MYINVKVEDAGNDIPLVFSKSLFCFFIFDNYYSNMNYTATNRGVVIMRLLRIRRLNNRRCIRQVGTIICIKSLSECCHCRDPCARSRNINCDYNTCQRFFVFLSMERILSIYESHFHFLRRRASTVRMNKLRFNQYVSAYGATNHTAPRTNI